MLRGLSLGLHRIMDFDANYLIGLVCADSRDLVILQALREIYPHGLGPKKLQKLLWRHAALKSHNFSRRTRRINKVLDKDMAESVFKKVGRNWALNRFMWRNWDVKVTDINEEE